MEQNELWTLLWACLKAQWTAETPASLALLSADEWGELFTLAGQQGVFSVLWHRLQSNGQQNQIPVPLHQRMQDRTYAASVRNLRLYHELGVILTGLRAQNIKVIVLKGAHLAATVYPHPGLRSMNDIDLLFLPTDVLAAVDVLQALGYQPSTPILWGNNLAAERHLPRFGKPGDVVAGVEVHWALTPPGQAYTIGMDEWWARATPMVLAGVEVFGLCPEDLLLYICEHATYQHQFLQRMRFLCDIDMLVRHYAHALDWAQVQQRAQDYHWAKGVHLALLLAQQLLATPVPSTVLQQLQAPGFSAHLTAIAIEQSFADYAAAGAISDYFAQLSVASSWREKAKIVWRRLWLPPQTIARFHTSPGSSSKLYVTYLARYKDLLMRYSGKLWRLWRKDPTLLNIIGINLEIASRKAELTEWLEQP
ncbi:MAG: nucleotidyltransferase family protein [Caldilineaceae bacterium]